MHEASRAEYEEPGDDTDVPHSVGIVQTDSSSQKEQVDEDIVGPDFKGGGSTLAGREIW